MEGYNAPKDLGYKVQNDYGPINQNSVSSYGGVSQQSSGLPIYSPINQENSIRSSQCPRGATLGKVASMCGAGCSGACKVPG
ncbi:MAG TPA: hypothetical protein VJI68_02575 [Candidatus Nanoarchaeia archaeon]|nr:hypothetical protein [Candidatus Nanoarchaeia archaeon]